MGPRVLCSPIPPGSTGTGYSHCGTPGGSGGVAAPQGGPGGFTGCPRSGRAPLTPKGSAESPLPGALEKGPGAPSTPEGTRGRRQRDPHREGRCRRGPPAYHRVPVDVDLPLLGPVGDAAAAQALAAQAVPRQLLRGALEQVSCREGLGGTRRAPASAAAP